MAITMTATLMRRISMRLIACLVLANFDAAAGWAQGPKYPPLSEYMMAPEAEVPGEKRSARKDLSACHRQDTHNLRIQGRRPRQQRVRVHSYARVGCGDIYHRAGTRPGLRCKTPRAPLLRPYRIPNRATASGAASQARVGRQGTGSDRQRSSGGICQRRAAENGGGRIRVHVLCGPGSWAGIGRVASSHDGVYAELRELDARRQRAR